MRRARRSVPQLPAEVAQLGPAVDDVGEVAGLDPEPARPPVGERADPVPLDLVAVSVAVARQVAELCEHRHNALPASARDRNPAGPSGGSGSRRACGTARRGRGADRRVARRRPCRLRMLRRRTCRDPTRSPRRHRTSPRRSFPRSRCARADDPRYARRAGPRLVLRESARQRPRHQHAIAREAEVPMQPARVMFLHDERTAPLTSSALRRPRACARNRACADMPSAAARHSSQRPTRGAGRPDHGLSA